MLLEPVSLGLSSFQMKIYVINVAVKEISRLLFVRFDSLVSIKALNWEVDQSKCVYNSIWSLDLLNQHQVELYWIKKIRAYKATKSPIYVQ